MSSGKFGEITVRIVGEFLEVNSRIDILKKMENCLMNSWNCTQNHHSDLNEEAIGKTL